MLDFEVKMHQIRYFWLHYVICLHGLSKNMTCTNVARTS